ncbi:MAG: hypothetical protein ACJATP_000256 [Candidatus Azotimanducaceae bacterium]|jgi:hypothetical protein
MPFANHLFADAMLTQEQMSDQGSENITPLPQGYHSDPSEEKIA